MSEHKPYVPDQTPLADWSWRGLVLGLIFGAILGSANAYLGLKVGLTISTSIPLAVIMVAVFAALRPLIGRGTILLAGIVVNNAIILVDYTNQLRREGLSKLEALQRACRVRLRPILMTTATTVMGLLPMAVGLGAGSELRRPMALTVIGGLITSTALTLLIIPAVYHLLDRSR